MTEYSVSELRDIANSRRFHHDYIADVIDSYADLLEQSKRTREGEV